MKRTTLEWVRKAEADLVFARQGSRSKVPLHDGVCFHCQQCAEKYLKRLFEELGLGIPKTHDLDHLLTVLLPRHSSALGNESAGGGPEAPGHRSHFTKAHPLTSFLPGLPFSRPSAMFRTACIIVAATLRSLSRIAASLPPMRRRGRQSQCRDEPLGAVEAVLR
jgi:hypothetical protein